MKKLLLTIPLVLMSCTTVSEAENVVRTSPVMTTLGSVRIEQDPSSRDTYYVLDHLIVSIQNKEVVLAEIRGVGKSGAAIFGFHLSAERPLIFGCKLLEIQANDARFDPDSSSYNLDKHKDIFVEEILFRFEGEKLAKIANASFFSVSFCGIEFSPSVEQMIQVREFAQSALRNRSSGINL